MEVIVQDANNIVIEVDQGRQGRGISTVGLVTVGADYYLLFTFTDGSTEQVGPIAPIVTEVLFAEARNAEATTILKGQPVYLFQAQGNLATVKLAFNTSDATSAKTLGLAAENIAPGAQGLITCQGTLGGLNTSAYSEGDTLYLGATAGTLTNVKPQAPNHLVYIGVVERANNGAGQIYVRVQNGYELDEIHDVQINSPLNGNTLIYDASTSLWKNAGITAGSGISVTNGPASITMGNTGVLSISGGTTGLTPATPTTGAVTLAGTLGIANGGTGQTTANASLNALLPVQTSQSGKYLKTDGSNAAWDQVDISTADITGTLPIANGGTGQTTANAGLNALLPSQTSQSGKYLKTDGTNASWDQLDISTADITGVLPTANGGTGLSSFTANRVLYASSTSAIGQSANLTFDGTTLGSSALNITGNTTLGDASTDAVQVNGYMGVGGAATVVDNAIHVKNTQLAGAAQTGVVSEITATSASTVAIQGFRSNVATAASAFTVADVSGFRMLNSTKGAGSTITNQHGVNIADLTSGTNNYGITSLVSSGSNKWNIYASGTAANYFAGNVGIGTTPVSYVGGIPSIRVGLYGGINGFQSPVTTSNIIAITSGAYAVSGAQQNYLVSGQAVTSYSQYLGQHRFYTAPSGTVDTAITFDERFNIGQTEAVFNDPGNDYDFRVESDTNTHAIFLDAGNSRVGINKSAPTVALDVTGDIAASGSITEAGVAVVVQTDVGTAPNQIPLNQYLGEMAYMNAEAVVIQPQASATPNEIGDMVFQLTSNTSLQIKVKGSDGTVRSVTLTLA